jgi:hypothetical protein
VISLQSYSGEGDLGGRTLSKLGLPPFDVFLARTREREVAYIPYGDAPRVLGRLASEMADSAPLKS